MPIVLVRSYLDADTDKFALLKDKKTVGVYIS